MKILQVIPYFYPAWTYGGPVRVAYDVSRGLAKRGHEVTVYTSDMKNCCTRIDSRAKEVDGIEVHYFRNLSAMTANEMKLFITLEIIPMIKRKIRSFDVAHLHEYRTFQNIVVRHYATKYGVPYVLQAHGSLPRIMAKQRLKWIYDVFFGYRLLKDASKVIALSQTEAEQYKGMGVPERMIEVIPNGIDLLEYGNLPSKGSFKKKFSIDDDKKIILYLGRIHMTKGIDFLVKAYAYLTKNMKYNNAVLVIAGPDDGYLAEAKSLCDSLSISDSVLFTGFISGEDKLKALVDSDVFVTPSFLGFPVTFLEACATGTPIITTTLEDTLEWIDTNVGYVTPPTHYDLARAIHTIISDDELREKFSRNCRKVVKSEFSLEKVVDRLEHVYREVAEGKAL